MLSSSESSDDEFQNITINKKYAKKYEETKRFQDLQRAKDMLEEDDDDASESESEDEYAEALNPKLDLQIINTIKSIRTRDPKIYDQSTVWYSEGDEREESGSDGETHTKMRFKDVLRHQILQDMEKVEEDSSTALLRPKSRSSLAYDAEQEQLRKSFIQATGSDDSDEDDMLRVKVKSSAELEAEEAELQKALQELQHLQERDDTSNKDAEQFLANYIMQKKWIDKTPVDMDGEIEQLQQDEQDIEQIDNFESKYNFRFEEQNEEHGGVGLVSHARHIEGSVRRLDDSRKKQRESRKERKRKEKRQKEEELKRLKNLKRQELMERLNKINEVGGLHDMLQIPPEMLDEDWDPEKHEAAMMAQFGDDYYNAAEGEDEAFVAAMKKKGKYEDGYDMEDYGEEGYDDYNYDYNDIEAVSPAVADTSAKQDILDNLYSLDYEDIVAGIPCRFKYQTCKADGFGLSAEDIILADDKELNGFVGLKKLSPYYHFNSDDQKVRRKLSKKRKTLRVAIRERVKELEEQQKKLKEVEKTVEVKTVQNGDAVEAGKKRRRRKKNKGSDIVSEAAQVPVVASISPAEIETLASAVQKPQKKKKRPSTSVEVSEKKKRLDLYK